MLIPRRRFIKFLTFGTATSVVGGKIWKRDLLAYCEPQSDQKAAVFKIKLSDYPALLESWGSVRLGINPVRDEEEPYPDGEFYPILINRDDQGNFYVLDSECQHARCVVPTFSNGNIHCPCHHSIYAVDGARIDGPTNAPLKSYPFEFDGNDTLTIQIPCWGVAVKVAMMPNPDSRIRLDFRAGGNVFYEVNFRECPTDPWTIVPFAMTPTDPATENSISSYFGGEDLTVYLDRTTATGFYAISTQISEV